MKTTSASISKTKGKISPQPVRALGNPALPPVKCDRARDEMVAVAAYFRAEQRGFAPGEEMSDWLQAEADVAALLHEIH